MAVKKDSVIQKETCCKIVSLLLAVCSVAAMGIDFENLSEIRGLHAVLASFNGWGLAQAVFTLNLAFSYYHI